METPLTPDQEKLINDNFSVLTEFMERYRGGKANDEQYSRMQWEYIKSIVRYDSALTPDIQKYIKACLFRCSTRIKLDERKQRGRKSQSDDEGKDLIKINGVWTRERDAFLDGIDRVDFEDIVAGIKTEESKQIARYLYEGYQHVEIAEMLGIKRQRVEYMILTKIIPVAAKALGVDRYGKIIDE